MAIQYIVLEGVNGSVVLTVSAPLRRVLLMARLSLGQGCVRSGAGHKVSAEVWWLGKGLQQGRAKPAASTLWAWGMPDGSLSWQ